MKSMNRTTQDSIVRHHGRGAVISIRAISAAIPTAILPAISPSIPPSISTSIPPSIPTAITAAIPAAILAIPAIILAAVSGAIPSQTLANGFYVDEQSVLHLGSAFSGTTTQENDASSAYYNPAALASSTERHITVNITPINASVDYDGETVTLGGESDMPVPVDVRGGDADIAATSVLPTLYASVPVNDRLTYGLGLNAPFNTETRYGRRSVARYQSITSSVTSVALTNAIAYKPRPELSIGIGLVAQNLEAELVQAVNPAVACFDGGAGSAACNDAGIVLDGKADFDGSVDISGDDLAFGINLGLSYRVNAAHSLALNYRSGIKHDLDAEAVIVEPVSAGTLRSDASVEVMTPATTVLGYHYTRDQLAFLAEASLTQWSSFDRLQFDADEPTVQPFLVTQTFDWEDSARFAVGAEYRMNPMLV